MLIYNIVQFNKFNPLAYVCEHGRPGYVAPVKKV